MKKKHFLIGFTRQYNVSIVSTCILESKEKVIKVSKH